MKTWAVAQISFRRWNAQALASAITLHNENVISFEIRWLRMLSAHAGETGDKDGVWLPGQRESNKHWWLAGDLKSSIAAKINFWQTACSVSVVTMSQQGAALQTYNNELVKCKYFELFGPRNVEKRQKNDVTL